jgi:hypothetical protein
MTISLKLLAVLNADSDWSQNIHTLSDYLESGLVSATISGDAIEALYLTPSGRAALLPTLPSATA